MAGAPTTAPVPPEGGESPIPSDPTSTPTPLAAFSTEAPSIAWYMALSIACLTIIAVPIYMLLRTAWAALQEQSQNKVAPGTYETLGYPGEEPTKLDAFGRGGEFGECVPDGSKENEYVVLVADGYYAGQPVPASYIRGRLVSEASYNKLMKPSDKKAEEKSGTAYPKDKSGAPLLRFVPKSTGTDGTGQEIRGTKSDSMAACRDTSIYPLFPVLLAVKPKGDMAAALATGSRPQPQNYEPNIPTSSVKTAPNAYDPRPSVDIGYRTLEKPGKTSPRTGTDSGSGPRSDKRTCPPGFHPRSPEALLVPMQNYMPGMGTNQGGSHNNKNCTEQGSSSGREAAGPDIQPGAQNPKSGAGSSKYPVHPIEREQRISIDEVLKIKPIAYVTIPSAKCRNEGTPKNDAGSGLADDQPTSSLATKPYGSARPLSAPKPATAPPNAVTGPAPAEALPTKALSNPDSSLIRTPNLTRSYQNLATRPQVLELSPFPNIPGPTLRPNIKRERGNPIASRGQRSSGGQVPPRGQMSPRGPLVNRVQSAECLTSSHIDYTYQFANNVVRPRSASPVGRGPQNNRNPRYRS